MPRTISGVKLNKRHESWMANAVDTLEWFRACGLWDAQVKPEQDPLQAVIDALNRTIGAIDAPDSKREKNQ